MPGRRKRSSGPRPINSLFKPDENFVIICSVSIREELVHSRAVSQNEFGGHRLKMIIIGICGGTSSGKSTLAKTIKEELSCSCVILGQDCYYFDQKAKPMEERAKVNYDSPDIFDHDELYMDVLALKAGRPITKKGYDFPNHCRADSDELIYPPEVLVIEGIHAFYDVRLMSHMDLKIYMRVDTDICLLRRIDRDMKKRGRTLESIAAQYKATVKPMYDEYISKYIDKADFAVMRGGKNTMASEAVTAYIEKKLLQEKEKKARETESK